MGDETCIVWPVDSEFDDPRADGVQPDQIPRFHKGYLPPENVEKQFESDRPDGALTSGLRLSLSRARISSGGGWIMLEDLTFKFPHHIESG